MKKCSLYIAPNHWLWRAAVTEIKRGFEILHIFDTEEKFLADQVAVNSKADIVLSFLNERILKAEALRKPNINFHPAPPWYPGRGGASRAIYDRRTTHGATAHAMSERPDTGKIYFFESFPINENDNCELIYQYGELACLNILRKIVTLLSDAADIQETMNKWRGETDWTGESWTKKKFQEWLVLKECDDIPLKIKATRHSKYPGPYIDLQGHRFELT